MTSVIKCDCTACIFSNVCKYKESYQYFDIAEDDIKEPIKDMFEDRAVLLELKCKIQCGFFKPIPNGGIVE